MLHDNSPKGSKDTMKSEYGPELNPTMSVAPGNIEFGPQHGTQRGLKSRHAQMIALGGTIGTGLFLGSGQALSMGGPLFLLLGYIFITILVYGISTATGEMSAYLPVEGCSMATYGERFFSKSMGFTLGWIYWYIFAITVPAEINATILILEYWNPPVHTSVWIVIIGVSIVVCNFLPVGVYGEFEFWFASTKVFAIVGLLTMSVVLFFGGGPSKEPLWFSNWNNPGPVKAYIFSGDAGRLVAIVSIVTFSVYAFAFAPELLVVTGGEMKSPRKNIPSATKKYFWRLVLFYVLGVLAIGIICPSNSPNLLSGTGTVASPWIIGIQNAGIPILPHIVNAVVVLSAWSAGNSYFYLASRALYSLAVDGNAPKIFTQCSKAGVPYYASAVCALVIPLAFMNLSSNGATVFTWFVNIINTGAFQSWICVCIIYIRFRKATATHSVTDLPYRSRFQPYTAYFSGVCMVMLLLLNGFKVFLYGEWDTSTFFTSYIGIPIFAGIYLGHKLTIGKNDPWVIPLEEIDLRSGLDQILEEEEAPAKRKNTAVTWLMAIFS